MINHKPIRRVKLHINTLTVVAYTIPPSRSKQFKRIRPPIESPPVYPKNMNQENSINSLNGYKPQVIQSNRKVISRANYASLLEGCVFLHMQISI